MSDKTKKVIGKKDLSRVIAQVIYRSLYHNGNGFDDIAAQSASAVGMQICMKTFQNHVDLLIENATKEG
tara:strand:- start:1114 stop:1320 length:207 start_codon:yes stop_codon:yes gene_type:complete